MEIENSSLEQTEALKPKWSQTQWGRITKYSIQTLLFVAILAIIPFYLINWVHPVVDTGIKLFAPAVADSLKTNKEVDIDALKTTINKELNKNRTKLNAFIPKQPYIVISLTENHYWLYNAKNKLVKDGACSSGSYTTLDNGKKTWTFKTPKGVHKIRDKRKDPVWVKPDWAFIEDGLPVPGPRHPSRYEPGVLGDYAMGIGDGYMIHGTIYQRFLGMAVTHGCIRLGDKDLEAVFKTLEVGSKVFVY
jgi:L,D-transpeptidase YbiS